MQTVARLRDADQWVKDSTILRINIGPLKKSYKRSDPLVEVDAKLRAYDKVRGKDDLDARMQALNQLATAIGLWRKSEEPDISNPDKETREAAQVHGAANVKHWQVVATLDTEVREEEKVVQNLINHRDEQQKQARQEARAQDVIDPLIPPELRAGKDVGVKARALFTIFMKKFQGKATYTTTTAKDVSIWDQKGTVACASICGGFVELLQRAGVPARVVQVGPENFITTEIGPTFIDPATQGNVRKPGKDFGATRRFFFSKHWIVAVEGGPYLDPTSGVETDANGAGVVDPVLRDFAAMSGGIKGYEKGGTRVMHVGTGPTGGLYELSEK